MRNIFNTQIYNSKFRIYGNTRSNTISKVPDPNHLNLVVMGKEVTPRPHLEKGEVKLL